MNACQGTLTFWVSFLGIRVGLSSFWPTELGYHMPSIPSKLISRGQNYRTLSPKISSSYYLRRVAHSFEEEVASAAFPLPKHPPTLVNCSYLSDLNYS